MPPLCQYANPLQPRDIWRVSSGLLIDDEILSVSHILAPPCILVYLHTCILAWLRLEDREVIVEERRYTTNPPICHPTGMGSLAGRTSYQDDWPLAEARQTRGRHPLDHLRRGAGKRAVLWLD